MAMTRGLLRVFRAALGTWSRQITNATTEAVSLSLASEPGHDSHEQRHERDGSAGLAHPPVVPKRPLRHLSGVLLRMSIAFSRARGRRIFRYNRRPSSRWWSI